MKTLPGELGFPRTVEWSNACSLAGNVLCVLFAEMLPGVLAVIIHYGMHLQTSEVGDSP
jgi:hypothetical protein